MSYRKYFLVHCDHLVWTRSGKRLAMYDSLEQARKFTMYHTLPHRAEPGPEHEAEILEFTIVDGEPAVRWA